MYTVNVKEVIKKELVGRDVYVLTEKLPVEKITSGICEVPPNSVMKPHKHEQEELIFILDGYGYVIIDGNKESISEGSLVHFPSSKEHLTCNESNDVMRFIFMFTPTVIVGSYG